MGKHQIHSAFFEREGLAGYAEQGAEPVSRDKIVSPEFIGSRDCVPMAYIAESSPAQDPVKYAQGSSTSSGCCLFGNDPIIT